MNENPPQEDKKKPNEPPKAVKYRLKAMVLARILAEVTALSVIVALPAILHFAGQLVKISVALKAVVWGAAGVSIILLPAYAFITFFVTVTDETISAFSLARRRSYPWHQLKSIARRSNFNWVRYVVEFDEGELTFPIWINDSESLIARIKAHLPGGGPAKDPFRLFSQDPISLIFQLLQAAFFIALVVVFWFFYADLAGSAATKSGDAAFILGFTVILSLLITWRTIMVLLMPRRVQTTPRELIVETLFFKRVIGWQEVKSVAPALPVLPEGFMIKTKKGSFLIGNGMDSADELVASVRSHLPPAEIEGKKQG